VKGDAYGHGAVTVARALAGAGCDAFGVALVEEGAELRDAGIGGLVLCLGGVGRYGAEEVVRRDLTPVLYDEGDVYANLRIGTVEKARAIADYGGATPEHHPLFKGDKVFGWHTPPSEKTPNTK
jgi:alanine racemase